MLEENELYPNGKLLYTKLEEVNVGLGDIKIGIVEGSIRSPRDEEAR